MTTRITILEPTSESKEAITAPVPYMKDLRGKKVVFVSNEGWRCLPTIWARLRHLLLTRHGVSDTLMVNVPMQHPATAETLDDIIEKGHVAIVGLGN